MEAWGEGTKCLFNKPKHGNLNRCENGAISLVPDTVEMHCACLL